MLLKPLHNFYFSKQLITFFILFNYYRYIVLHFLQVGLIVFLNVLFKMNVHTNTKHCHHLFTLISYKNLKHIRRHFEKCPSGWAMGGRCGLPTFFKIYCVLKTKESQTGLKFHNSEYMMKDFIFGG